MFREEHLAAFSLVIVTVNYMPRLIELCGVNTSFSIVLSGQVCESIPDCVVSRNESKNTFRAYYFAVNVKQHSNMDELLWTVSGSNSHEIITLLL